MLPTQPTTQPVGASRRECKAAMYASAPMESSDQKRESRILQVMEAKRRRRAEEENPQVFDDVAASRIREEIASFDRAEFRRGLSEEFAPKEHTHKEKRKKHKSDKRAKKEDKRAGKKHKVRISA